MELGASSSVSSTAAISARTAVSPSGIGRTTRVTYFPAAYLASTLAQTIMTTVVRGEMRAGMG